MFNEYFIAWYSKTDYKKKKPPSKDLKTQKPNLYILYILTFFFTLILRIEVINAQKLLPWLCHGLDHFI